FIEAVKPDEWARLQRMRPEVASPLWRLIVSPLVQAPASEVRFRVLAFLEPVAHAAALVAVRFGVGAVAAALVSVVWGAQPFFAFEGGATLLGNLWFVAWLVGLASWRWSRVNATPTSLVPFGAGASIGFGVCLQPLSAPALLPLVFAGVARWRTHR